MRCTAGATVNHCFVLFHYNIFKESVSLLKDIDVDLHALADMVGRAARRQGQQVLRHEDARRSRKFLHSPAEWSAAHGGATSTPQ